MKRWFLKLAVLLAAGPALAAEPVPIRSGEHASFSRLVMRIEEGTVWEIINSGDHAQVSIDQPEILLDASNVFSRIPKSRILSVIQNRPGGPLDLELNCECTVEGFVQDRIWLVVDVKGKPGSIPQKPKSVGSSFSLSLASTSFRYRFAGRSELQEPAAGESNLPQVQAEAPEIGSDQVVLPITLETVPSQESHGQLSLVAHQSGNPRPNLSRVSAMEERLLSQLERAGEQGLVEGGELSSADQHSEASPPRQDTERPLSAPIESARNTRANLAVTTSIDRELNGLATALGHVSGDNPECYDAQVVAAHKWGGQLPFGHQIGELRRGLFGEFDAVDPEAALALAKAYLHFGFGAEARQVLSMLPETEADAKALGGLARLLDGEPTGGVFEGAHACPGDTALWGVLAAPENTPWANHDAVLQAIARLPDHLRENIGPRVSQLYAEAGRAEEAAAAMRAVDRVVDQSTPAMEMAQGAAAELVGDTEAAKRHRLEVVEADAEQSPAALLALIESAYGENGTVVPEIVDLTSSYATEFRHSEIGADLRAAQSLAFALTGEFERAFELLEGIEAQDGREPRNEQEKRVLSLLVNRGSDLEFLRHTLTVSNQEQTFVGDDLGDQMARRFLDLGFSRPAVRLLSGSQANPPSKARRLLRAEAALGQELPHEAMIALLGIEGAEADRLRGEALRQLDRHEQAAEYLLASDAPEEAARSFWMAGAFRDLAPDQTSRYSEIGVASENLLSASDEGDELQPLARARALVEGSNLVRQDIQNLLDSVEVAAPDL